MRLRCRASGRACGVAAVEDLPIAVVKVHPPMGRCPIPPAVAVLNHSPVIRLIGRHGGGASWAGTGLRLGAGLRLNVGLRRDDRHGAIIWLAVVIHIPGARFEAIDSRRPAGAKRIGWQCTPTAKRPDMPLGGDEIVGAGTLVMMLMGGMVGLFPIVGFPGENAGPRRTVRRGCRNRRRRPICWVSLSNK